MGQKSPGNDETAGRRKATPFFDLGDVVISGILIVGAGFLYFLTTHFEEASALLGENVGPADFPRLVLYIIAVLALIMPFESRFQPARWQKIRDGRKQPVKMLTWMTIAYLLASIIAAPIVGTILTMLQVSLFLPLLWGERRLWLIVPFALIFTLAVTWVFNVVLRVYFEPGVFNITAKSMPLF